MRTLLWILATIAAVGCASFEGTPETLVLDTSATDTGTLTEETRDTATDSDPGTTQETDTEDPTDEVEDDAVIVAADLPTELDCGEIYAASVTVRNTGSATWTQDGGYKLGAVSDDDDLYGPDVRVWLEDGDSVASGETHVFTFDLVAPDSADDYLTDWQMVHEAVRWFGETTAETVTVTCSTQSWCDPLTDSSARSGFLSKSVSGGSFSAAGWQTTGDRDQLVLEVPTTLGGSTTFEIEVRNFDPAAQYAGNKHQIINMYTSADGSQGVFDTEEAWWNIRTGTNYGTGLKLLAAPKGGDSREEVRLIESASWDPADTHTFRVEWNSTILRLYLDGSQPAWALADPGGTRGLPGWGTGWGVWSGGSTEVAEVNFVL